MNTEYTSTGLLKMVKSILKPEKAEKFKTRDPKDHTPSWLYRNE